MNSRGRQAKILSLAKQTGLFTQLTQLTHPIKISPTAEGLEPAAFNLKWWHIASGVAVFFILVRCLFVVHYETIDDAVMELIAAGVGLASQPDHHILNTHFWTGTALSKLYSLCPNFPWYASYLELAQVAAVALAAAVFASAGALRSGKLSPWLVAIFLGGALQFIVNIQFTTTAMLLAISGALAVLHGLEQSVSKVGRTPFAWLNIGCITLTSSALVRFESTVLATALLSMFCVIAYARKDRLKQLLIGVAVAALVYSAGQAIMSVNAAYYKSQSGWNDFAEFNHLGGYFFDYKTVNLAPENMPAFRHAGWTIADLALMQTHFFTDPAIFNLTNLRYLVEHTHATAVRVSPSAIIKSLSTVFLKLYSIALVLATCICAGWVWNQLKWRYAAICSSAVGLLVAVGVLLKLEPRVYLPTLFWLLVISLYYGLKYAQQAGIAQLSVGQKSLAVCACLLSVILCFSSGLNAQQKSVQLTAAMQKFHPAADKLYIVWGSSMRYDGKLPFESLNKYYKGFSILPGFLTHTAIGTNQIWRHGASSVRAALLDQKAYLISNPYLNRAYVESYRYHYGSELHLTPIFEDQKSDLHVYSAVSSP